ncbi:glutathione S-transferase family protein [Archangium violaceum]|uniref:glutathione S-transferase family protein n=1 Tax=Archangium violaceum TaxID=83451 RepID=UPI002B302859|nr:glutathione S-transferase family protein [Archangium violaceum]
MITLYQTPVAWGTPNLSPFCFKLESYLRMAGIPYSVKLASLATAPKGKVPYVEIDGKLMGDSQFIIDYLKNKHGDSLDAKLTPEQLAIGHTIRRMLEECTYWYIVYMRWVDEEGWRAYTPVVESMIPGVVGGPVPLTALRQKMLQILHDQGTGRHTMEEVQVLAKADISAIATLMGKKSFLLGDEPSSFDAVVYAFLVSIIANPVDTELKQYTLSQENLVRYCARFKARFFANWKPPESQAA